MRLIYAVLLSLFLTACATVQTDHKSDVQKKVNITSFQGRLLVFSPKHRFQVLIQWQANLSQGYARLTHPASGRVVEIRWYGKQLSMRDNQTDTPTWRPIDDKQWQKMGIVLPPWTLAKVLHHQMPRALHSKDGEIWKGKINGGVIQLHWQNDYHLLTMVDITHGRKAILRINP